MSTIDYSKWDMIDCSSSDEEEESTPRVTKFDGPSRITRRADGTVVVGGDDHAGTEKRKAQGPAPDHLQRKKTTVDVGTKIQEWTVNGGEATTDHGLKLIWSQDRYSVCLRLSLPSPEITAKDINVQLRGVSPYGERTRAVGTDRESASIRIACSHDSWRRVLLEGEFPHPIHATDDDDDDKDDWEIDRATAEDGTPMAHWVMTLQKATPMAGMVIWWRRPLKQFPEIAALQANPNDPSKAKAFQQAWDEAHERFREQTAQKMKEPKIMIP